ncbi:glycerol-3-phosphate dehydrogenase [Wuchereria bancrofti]|uniref:glycerol-3-phosphate dehydrogenase (NAD(+)) n=1 Tax=Wuchereria bancrofti TaxID=6293 RepID=J9EZC8_WUCBA|nr:glycerol-3-phosphate dehydrogenase [Wuchereria bancrofti]
MKHKAPPKITLVGSGNWGSTIALIVGRNAGKHKNDSIQKFACGFSDSLHRQRYTYTTPLERGRFGHFTYQTFLIDKKEGVIRLVSEGIRGLLNIDTAVPMGANVLRKQRLAVEVKKKWPVLKKSFESDNFRINLTKDSNTVELCGGLKNVVACAAGFADGLGYGSNTKAAIVQLGLLEIIVIVELFYHDSNIQTYFESCGIADLIATCNSGRNRKICEAFVKTRKSIQDLE